MIIAIQPQMESDSCLPGIKKEATLILTHNQKHK